MASKGYILSADDLALLRTILEDYRNKDTERPRVLPPDEEDWLSPEAYVAVAPSGSGIPKLDNAVPGEAECEVYRLTKVGSDQRLVATGKFINVYNLMGVAIPPRRAFLTVRDKFGRWLVSSADYSDENVDTIGTGTGTGTGTTAANPGCFITVVTQVCFSTELVEKSIYDLNDCSGGSPRLIARWCETSPSDCCLVDTGTGTGTVVPPHGLPLCCPISSWADYGAAPGVHTVPATLEWEGGTINGYAIQTNPATDLYHIYFPPEQSDDIRVSLYISCDDIAALGGNCYGFTTGTIYTLQGFLGYDQYNQSGQTFINSRWFDGYTKCNQGSGFGCNNIDHPNGDKERCAVANILTLNCEGQCISFRIYPSADNPHTQQPIHLHVGWGCAGLTGTGTGTGGGGGSPIASTPLGATSSAGTATTLTLSSKTVLSGELLLVAVAVYGADNPSVTFNGTPMTSDVSQAGAFGRIALFSLDVVSNTTGDIVLTVTPGPSFRLLMAAEAVSGLADNAFDVHATDFATSSSALDVGPTGTTATAFEFIYSVFGLLAATTGYTTGVWTNGFSADQIATTTITSNTIGLTTGYQLPVATGTFTGAKTGAATGDWIGLVAAYR